MDKTIIEIDEENLKYQKDIFVKQKISNIFLIVFICIFILFCSTLYNLAYIFENETIIQLNKYKKIKKNMNSWQTIITEKTAIEINKGKLLYASKSNIGKFQCLDMGSYYTVGRISDTTFLPEFVKRGNSGPWVINKTADIDISAKQFCLYLIEKYVPDNLSSKYTITCGTQMNNELGYSGYFINNSPCENAIKTILLTN